MRVCASGEKLFLHTYIYIYIYTHGNRRKRIKSLRMVIETSDKNQFSHDVIAGFARAAATCPKLSDYNESTSSVTADELLCNWKTLCVSLLFGQHWDQSHQDTNLQLKWFGMRTCIDLQFDYGMKNGNGISLQLYPLYTLTHLFPPLRFRN